MKIDSGEMEINPAYVDAPYSVSFCFGLNLGRRRFWSRKRRLKASRRIVRQHLRRMKQMVREMTGRIKRGDFDLSQYAN